MCMFMGVWVGAHIVQEGVRCPGATITGSCELTKVGAEVLTTEAPLQPHPFFLN